MKTLSYFVFVATVLSLAICGLFTAGECAGRQAELNRFAFFVITDEYIVEDYMLNEFYGGSDVRVGQDAVEVRDRETGEWKQMERYFLWRRVPDKGTADQRRLFVGGDALLPTTHEQSED